MGKTRGHGTRRGGSQSRGRGRGASARRAAGEAEADASSADEEVAAPQRQCAVAHPTLWDVCLTLMSAGASPHRAVLRAEQLRAPLHRPLILCRNCVAADISRLRLSVPPLATPPPSAAVRRLALASRCWQRASPVAHGRGPVGDRRHDAIQRQRQRRREARPEAQGCRAAASRPSSSGTTQAFPVSVKSASSESLQGYPYDAVCATLLGQRYMITLLIPVAYHSFKHQLLRAMVLQLLLQTS